MKKSTLDKQLAKSGCTRLEPPTDVTLWASFLAQVELTYQQAAADRDLLERALEISSREMQEKIRESEQMAIELVEAIRLKSLGTMTSGLAHELNNPIAGIKGHAQLLLQTETSAAHRQRIERIVSLCNRMGHLVGSIKRLSRRTEAHELKSFDLRAVILEATEFFRAQLAFDRIALVTDLPEVPVPIFGDAVAMVSVIQNLIGNSRDAFGKVNGSKQILVQATVAADMVRILYLDNAGGMPPHVLSRIFEPFFTTKEPGEGTGLGLALVRRIVTDHKGLCEARCYDDKTEFVISLPIVKEFVIDNVGTAAAVAGLDAPLIAGKRPVIAVVDDEQDIVDLLREHLKNFFDVITFTDPEKAAREIPHRHIDLLLTDMRMPTMSGSELISSLRSIEPNLPVVTMSGHVSETADDMPAIERNGHLSKPFDSLDSVIVALTQALSKNA